MSELKKCPFCGGEAEITINKTRQGQTSVVTCAKCTCRKTLLKYPFYEGDIYADAVKDWNTRKPMERIMERLKEKKTYAYERLFDGGSRAIGFCEAITIVKEEGGLHE